ncbi:MAG: hypothetical protein WD604_16670 [Balneolaceae bacterium]
MNKKNTNPAESNTSCLRFRMFQFMWLVFILFHMAISSPGWSSVGNAFLNPSSYIFLFANILVIVFSLLSLFRPGNMFYFISALAFLTVVKIDALPSIPNHIVLTLIIHFTLFLSLILYWDTSLKIKERIGRWFDKTAPFLRVELLILYFFVVLHKINYDFFNPAVSCASELYADIAAFYPFFPQGQWIDQVIIFFTFLPELIIPVLLIIPSTRVLGVILGMLFHFMLSLHPNLYILSFTAEIFALYILFLPGKLIVEITEILQQKINRINIKRLAAGVSVFSLLMIAAYASMNVLVRGGFSVTMLKEDLPDFFLVTWIIWGLILITGVLIFFRNYLISASVETVPFFSLSWSPLLIFLLLAVFNGMNPYIGLKTTTNFAMFSNLKVDGSENNHMFISSAFQVADLQNDTVTLLETNHTYLQDYIEWNERITYFELSRFLFENRSEDIEVIFQRKGELYVINLAQHQADDFLESSWIARKMLAFRGVPQEGPTPCQW